MWYCPEKYNITLPDVNQDMMKLEGELEEEMAKITLAKFLRANLGFTTEIISGFTPVGFQEVLLKAFFNRHFSLFVGGRGCSKSTIAGIFIFLYAIFEPGTKILIAGPTFRTSRLIFGELEKIVNSPEAGLLAQCFTKKPTKRNDLFEWEFGNGSTVRAVPLGGGGEKIRGIRANVLIVDEFLLITEYILKSILMPFLMASDDIKSKIKVREQEDDLIKAGVITENDREQFKSKSKVILLSSASYTFEYLYVKYKEWVEKIYEKEENIDAKYFVAQLSYEAVPDFMWDKTLIEEAKNGGTSHASFQREYRAHFVDDSDSYFSMAKMQLCTIPDGQSPYLELMGEKGAEYILSIDPSFSNSNTSDNFAISLLKKDSQGHGNTIHNYAVAGGDLKDHIEYFFYLLTHFNIVLIIMDGAGGRQFIEAANLSPLFQEHGIELKFMDFDSDKEGTLEYNKILKEARHQYNLQNKRICIEQVFTSDWIRKANEYLQANIDHKRVWFASRISPNESLFEQYVQLNIPMKLTHFEDINQMIEEQDILINNLKKECALIEVKSTTKGTQSFDLPIHLQKSKSPKRARKDSYTALLLGNWGLKCYNDFMNLKSEPSQIGFIPFRV